MDTYFVESAIKNISFEKYECAICDLRKAIQFNPYNETSYILKIQVSLHLGDLDGLEEGINDLKLTYPNNKTIKSAEQDIITIKTFIKQANKFAIKKKYDEAVKQINSALQIATSCKYLSSLKNQYMIDEKDQNEVIITSLALNKKRIFKTKKKYYRKHVLFTNPLVGLTVKLI